MLVYILIHIGALIFSTKQDQQYGVLAEIFFSGSDTNTEKRG
jgi:hypothetical protein